MLDFLKIILVVMLFWSLGITLMTHTIPAQYLSPVQLFVYSNSADTLNTVGPELEANLQSQVNLPIVDMAALVFYSGNLLIDLALNFLTAVPEMFTLILQGFFMLAPNIAPDVQKYLKLFVYVALSAMYVLALISWISSSRSGGGSSMTIEAIAAGLAEALGFGLPDLVLVLTALGAIILFSKDLKVGIVSLFMLFAIEFVLFANLNWDTMHVILALFITMALMAISLFMEGGSTRIIN